MNKHTCPFFINFREYYSVARKSQYATSNNETIKFNVAQFYKISAIYKTKPKDARRSLG